MYPGAQDSQERPLYPGGQEHSSTAEASPPSVLLSWPMSMEISDIPASTVFSEWAAFTMMYWRSAMAIIMYSLLAVSPGLSTLSQTVSWSNTENFSPASVLSLATG